MKHSPDPLELIPLTPLVFHVLLSLADQDRHGYAIIHDVRERSQGRVRIGSGSLYAAIRRLRKSGLILESGDRPAPELDDERRRYYVITALGRRVLAAELTRMREAIRLAESLFREGQTPAESPGE